MASILLLTPPMRRAEMFARGSEATASLLPPLGPACIAAYIRECGHTAQIIDGAVDCREFEELADIAGRHDVIGLSVVTAYYPRAKELLEYLRARHPRKLIIAGGPHVTARPMDLFPGGVDIVVRGEGELTVKELLDWHDAPERLPLSDIQGIVYRSDDGEIHKNISRPLIENLDFLPAPALDLLPMRKYGTSIARSSSTPSLSLMTSRGCTGICSFCNHQMFGKKIRRFSPDRVVGEFFRLRDEFGANSIAIMDDNFVEDQEYVKAVCEELIDKGFDKPFSVEARVDSANIETFRMLRSAGCDYIAFGFECGSQRILDYIKKNQTMEQMYAAARLARQAGLKIRGYFIMGFPTETPEEMESTVRLAKDLNIDVASFTLLVPFPGTLDYLRAQKTGSFDPLFFEKQILAEFNFPEEPIYIPEGLDAATLLKLHKNAYTRYYFSPKIILEKISAIRRWQDVSNLLKGASTLASNYLFKVRH